MPWTIFETALGPCGIAWTDAGVSGFQLPEENAEATAARLSKKGRGLGKEARVTKRAVPPWIATAIDLARAHLDGAPQDFRVVPLDLAGLPPFTAKVYQALREIPPGKTVTYGELAGLAGSPGASRAVGRAMATNPIPLLVACHRVLASAGKPGGFSAYGGLVTKDRILQLEGWKGGLAPDEKATASLFAAGAANVLPYDARAALAHLTTADPRLGEHLAETGDFALTLKDTDGVFAALAEAIVYQQLNGKAAATIFGRVRALFPRGKLDPKKLVALTDDALRGAGLSRSKLAALRDLATRTVAGEIPTLKQLERMTDDEIVATLTKVRGIGRWTVEMLLIFRLGRPDVLPVADYGIKKGYAKLFHRGKKRDELPLEADMIRRGEKWKPFRSVASWYLWRAADT